MNKFKDNFSSESFYPDSNFYIDNKESEKTSVPENQISKILDVAEKEENPIILYTIVDNNLAKSLAKTCNIKKIF